MSARVEITLTQGVADVRLARAEKMNALDSAMFTALLETGERLRQDKEVRAVVLSGAGKSFCAGLDMQSFERMRHGGSVGEEPGGPLGCGLIPRTFGNANAFQRVATMWRELPVPVIAAVQGAAFGGGLQIALGADIRYVAADARLSVREIKWGLVPDMAGILYMRELARSDVVRELTFSGRVFSGEEAVQLGLATQVHADPYAAAMAAALQMARQSPDALRAAKRLLNLPVSAEPASVLLAESLEQDRLIGSPNQLEAVRANLEERLPRFID